MVKPIHWVFNFSWNYFHLQWLYLASFPNLLGHFFKYSPAPYPYFSLLFISLNMLSILIFFSILPICEVQCVWFLQLLHFAFCFSFGSYSWGPVSLCVMWFWLWTQAPCSGFIWGIFFEAWFKGEFPQTGFIFPSFKYITVLPTHNHSSRDHSKLNFQVETLWIIQVVWTWAENHVWTGLWL